MRQVIVEVSHRPSDAPASTAEPHLAIGADREVDASLWRGLRIRKVTTELSIMSARRIDAYCAGFLGHVLPSGELQILDSGRAIVATYPSSSWTILLS